MPHTMKPRSKKIIIASAAAGVVALVGVAGYAVADPTNSPSPKPSASGPADPGHGGPGGPGPGGGGPGWPGGGPGGHRGGPGRGDFGDGDLAKQLATKLGIDEAKVSDALKAIREANRPAKPSTAPSGPPTAKPSAAPSGKPTWPDPSKQDGELAKQLAGKLGIDEAKVTKAFEEIRADRQAEQAKALQSRLDAAVKAGTLTQAEADAVTKAVEKGVISGR